MEKNLKGSQPVMRKAVNLLDFGAIINRIKEKMAISISSGSASASAILRGGYHTCTGYGSGHFKQNQRKERALSRRRKMKPNAR